jgi:hypothetical protein
LRQNIVEKSITHTDDAWVYDHDARDFGIDFTTIRQAPTFAGWLEFQMKGVAVTHRIHDSGDFGVSPIERLRLTIELLFGENAHGCLLCLEADRVVP